MSRLVIATAAVSQPMGAQQYESEVTSRAAAALGPGWQVTRSIARSVRSELPGTQRLPFGLVERAPEVVRRGVGRVAYPRSAVVHRMSLSLPPAPQEVVTLHDIVAWMYPDEGEPIRHAATELRRAAAVICVSQFTADEAAGFLGLDPPTVIHNGVDPRFAEATPLDADRLADLGVPPGPFVLHAGGSSLRKNLAGLADAWPRIRSAVPGLSLVLSGPPSARRDELFGPLDGAHRIGRVDGAVVPGLVSAAQVVVVPSLHEGFGLPALEAMAAGVPVVAARRSSLPEVCGDAGILVEPDGASIADGVVWAASEDAEIEAMVALGRTRAAGFTWERTAAAHARVWESVVSG